MLFLNLKITHNFARNQLYEKEEIYNLAIVKLVISYELFYLHRENATSLLQWSKFKIVLK